MLGRVYVVKETFEIPSKTKGKTLIFKVGAIGVSEGSDPNFLHFQRGAVKNLPKGTIPLFEHSEFIRLHGKKLKEIKF
jgi:hypothetical protein